jgi:hypothetical protein
MARQPVPTIDEVVFEKIKEEKGKDLLPESASTLHPEDTPDTGQGGRREALVLIQPQQVTAAPSKDIVVQPGDSLACLASERYGYVTSTLLDLLRVANPSIRDIDHLPVGQRLSLPEPDGAIRTGKEKGGSYSYLLLSTPFREEAASLSNLLKQRGRTHRISPTPTGRRRIFYRVLVTGFPSQQAAAEEGKNLEQVVTHKFLRQKGEGLLCSTQTTRLKRINR